ncbi:MAG: hypothetical protein LBJ35_06295 [Spirochaetaceae bacterium]|jgi:hypothetical protein|nr:hypothetical protein [Spirochaetaceae bacterium]
MTNTTKNTVLRGFAVCVLTCLAASCIGGEGGRLNIPAEKIISQPSITRLYYFFDRTASMKGFTAKGDDSEYVNALPALWEAADISFSGLDARFYEYGETYTNEFEGAEALSAVRKEVLRGEFYGGTPKTGGIRTLVKSNGGQPFTAVTDYIKTLDEADSAFIIVTDLYEQNRDDPFSRFYRYTFSQGLSAAFFAVEASFSGDIHSVSRIDVQNKSIQARDGKSTFYICIAGDSYVVSAYCAALAKEFTANKITFENAVFIVSHGEKLKLFHDEPPVIAGNSKMFWSPENAFKMVNLRPEEISLIGESSSNTQIEAYQLLTKTGSRWTAGLPLANINPASFNYNSDFSLSYCGNWSGHSGEASSFNGISNSTNVNMRLDLISEIESPPQLPANMFIPLYLVIETANNRLDKGWYKINYDIIPDAIVLPEWVSALNAEDISALESSARERGTRIKTLQLANVYEKIAEAYNNVRSRNVYSDELYLLKR